MTDGFRDAMYLLIGGIERMAEEATSDPDDRMSAAAGLTACLFMCEPEGMYRLFHDSGVASPDLMEWAKLLATTAIRLVDGDNPEAILDEIQREAAS